MAVLGVDPPVVEGAGDKPARALEFGQGHADRAGGLGAESDVGNVDLRRGEGRIVVHLNSIAGHEVAVVLVGVGGLEPCETPVEIRQLAAEAGASMTGTVGGWSVSWTKKVAVSIHGPVWSVVGGPAAPPVLGVGEKIRIEVHEVVSMPPATAGTSATMLVRPEPSKTWKW